MTSDADNVRDERERPDELRSGEVGGRRDGANERDDERADESEDPDLEEVTAEELVEDAIEYFGEEYRGEPLSDADAPPPG